MPIKISEIEEYDPKKTKAFKSMRKIYVEMRDAPDDVAFLTTDFPKQEGSLLARLEKMELIKTIKKGLNNQSKIVKYRAVNKKIYDDEWIDKVLVMEIMSKRRKDAENRTS